MTAPASPTNSLTIKYFIDYVCPWCYLSSAAVARLEQEFPVDIQWVPFPLHPSTPQEGMTLDELFAGRDMSAAQAHLEKLINEAGLEYGFRNMTYNTRLAQELGKWANTQSGGKAIHTALYRAYFVEGLNLADEQVLLDTAASIGLDRNEAARVLKERPFSQAVDEDWQRARNFQISGVPAFVCEGYLLSGCQPYDELARFTRFILDKQNSGMVSPHQKP